MPSGWSVGFRKRPTELVWSRSSTEYVVTVGSACAYQEEHNYIANLQFHKLSFVQKVRPTINSAVCVVNKQMFIN